MSNQINLVALERVLDSEGDKAAKGGGWLAAIAKAMGKAMGLQAARVVSLSNQIADNASSQASYADSHVKDGIKQSDPGLAAKAQALNAQFAAASQELSYTSNSFSTAIKALGEASTTMARKNG